MYRRIYGHILPCKNSLKNTYNVDVGNYTQMFLKTLWIPDLNNDFWWQ